MYKILVELYVPIIESKYELFIPVNKKISNVIYLLVQAINELSDENFPISNKYLLYNKETGLPYDLNQNVKDANITNGTKLILE